MPLRDVTVLRTAFTIPGFGILLITETLSIFCIKDKERRTVGKHDLAAMTLFFQCFSPSDVGVAGCTRIFPCEVRLADVTPRSKSKQAGSIG